MLANSNGVVSDSDGYVELRSLVKILVAQKSGLKICHLNAQSLRCKMDEFRVIFEGSGVDVVCISETWFSSNVNDTFLKLAGYKLFRADRSRCNGGGVAIYLKENITCVVNVGLRMTAK